MDYLVPTIAIIVGAAILAPGVIRYFKTQNRKTDGCGSCSGCQHSVNGRRPSHQIVKLKRK